jgi:ParB family chromosome partitioning protein
MPSSTPSPLPSRRTGGGAPPPSARGRRAFGIADDTTGVLVSLPVERVVPNPGQPRKHFDQAALKALAESIKQRGVLQPLVVRPAGDGLHEIVAGERRWRAAQIAGLARVPCVVRSRDDASTLQDALIENMVREDLTPIEEARCLRTLIDDLGVTHAALAAQLDGRSRSDITNTMRLLDLPGDVVDLIDAGELTKGHGKVLLGAGTETRQRELAARAVAEALSVRALERLVSPRRTKRAAGAAGSPDADVERVDERLRSAVSGASVSRRGDRLVVRLPGQRVDLIDALIKAAHS